MTIDFVRKSLAAAGVAALCLQAWDAAWSQPAWRPEKAVEIILPTAAGGANDVMARLIQKILQDLKLVTVPVVVMNKAGGNQTLAAVYLRQHPADPHYLLYSTSSVFTTEITGLTQQHYADLAPIALMLVERTVITVRADSSIRNMRDLIDRLEADPGSIAFGMVSRGGSNHLALAQAVKSAGVDPKRLKTVVFKTNVESMTGLAGGHLQAVASSATAAFPWVQTGQARMLAIAAPERQAGALANVPTLREQGIDVAAVTNWRGIFGPKGLTAAQIAFWEDALARTVATEEWKKPLEQNNLGRYFLRSKDFAKFLEAEYIASRAALTDLGFAK
jgi:putative tricarboxylic transport membrane protein